MHRCIYNDYGGRNYADIHRYRCERGSFRRSEGEDRSVNHESTGAPGFFAQIIFPVIDGKNHFIGGKRNSTPHVFIHGLIRSGRSADVKQALIRRAIADVLEITGVGPEDIWMYIQDLDAAQMVEFGRFLPEPGGEAQWRNALTSRKLADFARDGIAA